MNKQQAEDFLRAMMTYTRAVAAADRGGSLEAARQAREEFLRVLRDVPVEHND